MSNTYNGLTIIIPSDDYEEPESIRQEGQGSFKIQEQFAGKKRKAEGFSDDLPIQPIRHQPTTINSK